MGSEDSIGRWISLIFRQEQIYIGKGLKEYKIGFGQVPFLMTLYNKDGLSQEEITKQLYVDKATTGRAMKKLAEEGYVRRKRDPSDKRAYQIFLTEKGKRIKPEVIKVLRDWTSVLSSDFSKEEKDEIIASLKRMFQNALQSRLQSSIS